MKRALIASFLALATSGCAYRPTAIELIRITETPADLRPCLSLGPVSAVVPTTPGFRYALQAMLAATVALGGTDLYLEQVSPTDWLYVRGIAYRCNVARREPVVLRVGG